MSALLNHAPRFSSGAALYRHYRAVKQRMLSLAPPPVMALPSPDMMARGNLMPAPPVVPEPARPVYIGELQTVDDAIPSQHLALVRNVRALPPDLERIAARRAIWIFRCTISETPRFNRLLALKKAVACAFKIHPRGLQDAARTRGIVRVRQIAICLARKFELGSLSEVGNAFGGRDHTTVLHAFNKMLPLVEEVLAEMPSLPDPMLIERERICRAIFARYGRIG